MNSFFYLREVINGRTVVATKTHLRTDFSFIIFALDDRTTIVVVRERAMKNGKVRSFGVVDIKSVSTDLKTTLKMIKEETFHYNKEPTNDWNVEETLSVDKVNEKTAETGTTSNRIKSYH